MAIRKERECLTATADSKSVIKRGSQRHRSFSRRKQKQQREGTGAETHPPEQHLSHHYCKQEECRPMLFCLHATTAPWRTRTPASSPRRGQLLVCLYHVHHSDRCARIIQISSPYIHNAFWLGISKIRVPMKFISTKFVSPRFHCI